MLCKIWYIGAVTKTKPREMKNVKTLVVAQLETIFVSKSQRNAKCRAENAALRELCGTSARAAREDTAM